ncbi:tetratricopeptide repeat protein [Propionivibrio sp.]|uniref:tetratricopeptide repeat protein n=1 Tax=Propionivibrio sp. TaxID=2212460 RepID=UPI003BF3B2C1
MRQNNVDICSLCCVEIRDESCTGCSHYTAAQKYRATRSPSAILPDGYFIPESNKEVEEAVNFAMELAERGKTNEAWAALNKLLGGHPDNHRVCYGMGTLHAISGDFKESINWFEKAISIFPYFVEAHFNKALSHQKLFDVGNAVRAYRKVLEYGDPRDTPAKQARSFLDSMAASIRENDGIDLDSYIESQSEFDRAFKLMEQRDWSGALAGFRASAAKNDRNPPIHGNMGLCLASLGHKAQALAEFDRALELDPQYLPAATNRVVAESMEEGIPLNVAGLKRIEFGKERFSGLLEEKK